MDAAKIIIVDDDEDIRKAYAQALELEGLEVEDFAGGAEALEAIHAGRAGVVVSDLRMPHMDGLELLDRIRAIDPELPVVMVSAHGDVPVAVDSMHKGAYDFLEKPPDPLHMLKVVQRALSHRNLVLENRDLRRELKGRQNPLQRIIGKTPVMNALRQTIATLANADVDTLITGQTGTGKELVANALHQCGPRAKARFVALNCAALPESLIESELFGHERGAFTNAHSTRIGKLEYADGGVLFLDEIEAMSMAVQAKLLRVLQERNFERIGSNTPIDVDITVIAAAKADLERLSEQGEFRSDLYYRLNVAALQVPPLTERLDDIPLLFNAMVQRVSLKRNLPAPNVPPELPGLLQQHDWPGNVRELRNIAEKFVLGLPLGILPGQLPPPGPSRNAGLAEMVDNFEHQAIARALTHHGGRVGATAEALGLPRKTLYLRMQKYGLRKEDFVNGGEGG
ncbi:MAG: Fis family transcriptional regulator [Hyphomicrobiales bacterium]|nr:MAG: Fis family transcriptional regulator [Hyphomicrobiales bacterium]